MVVFEGGAAQIREKTLPEKIEFDEKTRINKTWKNMKKAWNMLSQNELRIGEAQSSRIQGVYLRIGENNNKTKKYQNFYEVLGYRSNVTAID